MKDSRGQESITLKIVITASVALIFKFIIGGVSIGPVSSAQIISAEGFGIGLASIMLIWLGREWTEKVAKNAKTDN